MQLAIVLPKYSPLPLYRQLSNALKDAIVEKRVQPGDKLPSTRELASSLAISRLTVRRAVDDIVSQGYVETIQGSGSYVSKSLNTQISDATRLMQTQNAERDLAVLTSLSAYGRRVDAEPVETSAEKLTCDFETSIAPWDQLPIFKWRKMLHQASRFEDANEYSLHKDSDPLGYLPLRQALANYLMRSRSIRCDAAQIAIFPTVNGGTDHILRLLTESGDTVAVENPGNCHFRNSASWQGLKLFSAPVDSQGLIIQALNESAEKIKLLYVTPSHHDPSGATLSPERRNQLLNWAAQTKAFVIEDDVDCEYRYGERLLPAVSAMDTDECMIYKSSFRGVLFPLVRFGFMVLPRKIAQLVTKSRQYADDHVPLLEQRALADLINEGHLERHIKHTQLVYAKRRAATIHALTVCNRERVTIVRSAGLHLVVRFSGDMEVDTVLRCAQKAGVPLISTQPNYVLGSLKGEYKLAFAYTSEDKIASNISRFTEELKSADQVAFQQTSLSNSLSNSNAAVPIGQTDMDPYQPLKASDQSFSHNF